MSVVTVWDGKFIQHREQAQAEADLAAGLIQVFAGPHGYVPGFTMKMGSEFPLAGYPAATLDTLTPDSALVDAGPTEITLAGTNFRPSDSVLVDGSQYQNVALNSTTKQISIDVAEARTYTVAVREISGRITASKDFTVTAAAARSAKKTPPPAPPVVEPDPLNDE